MKERHIGRAIGRVLLVLFTTLLLLVLAVVGVVYVVLRGPSVHAQELLTRTLKETSAVGFVPDLFLPDERVAEIMSYREEAEDPSAPTDTSLVTIRATAGEIPVDPENPAPEYPAGYDTGDGIEFVNVTGASYRGIMMIVQDPTRLFVGTPDAFGGVGLTLEQMIEKYDAAGGVNGGGFDDPNGTGLGGVPEGIVIVDGELKWGGKYTTASVIGFDSAGILHVGRMTGQQALDADIQWACSFGPVLVLNGEGQSGGAVSGSGVNPRTAIGQRADGAVLLLVVDGRQVTSLGATKEELVNIMLEFGAVNAANLDGGSSTQMIYEGETLNINASVIGTRPLPTAFLVRKQGTE